ncbi:MAG TPA: lysophospholipid acyltransferase family protein [Caulobacteraceae bacterium]|nr:lysophospholipid acyltransferase family protein [Caulobacteraceae bacterium]
MTAKMRKALHAAWLFGVTGLLMILYLPLLLLPRAAMRGGLKLWAVLMVFGMRWIGGVRLEIRGTERLPPGAYLIAAKHQSWFDIVSPFLYAPDALFVMKKELGQIPAFGWLSRKAGMIEVDREAHAKALMAMLADARRLMAEPRQLLIFPEGSRSPPGAATSYKPGVAALYRELDLPCVPVATNSGVFLDPRGVALRPGVVVVEILEPLPPGLKRGEFMRLLQDRIDAASAALL